MSDDLLNKSENRDETVTPVVFYQFIRLFLLSIGVAFTLSGIVFFFAYNWTDLNKFAKLGLILMLIVGGIGVLPTLKTSLTLKKIILTGAAALVGVLFAVFGQIYQTGANAYDFFLAWTLFIALWVVVSDFPPLWLLFLVLIETTVILYLEQSGINDSRLGYILLFGINATALAGLNMLLKVKCISALPDWFTWIVGIAAMLCFTTVVVLNIVSREFVLETLVFTAAVCGLVSWYSKEKRDLFYLLLVSLCVLSVCEALLFRLLEPSDSLTILFVLTIFTIGSITGLIRFIVYVQKYWKNGK